MAAVAPFQREYPGSRWSYEVFPSGINVIAELDGKLGIHIG
jgi:hypothetical protein